MTDLQDKLEIRKAAGEGNAESALTIYDRIRKQEEQIAAALPAGMDAGRFVRMILTEVKRTPRLLECSPESVLGGMMLSAQTGLEPGGPLGQAFLIPRRMKGKWEAQFQIGWKGYVQLAARAGITVTARTVYEGDEFDWQYGTQEYLRHRPLLDNDAPSIAWYAIGHAPGQHPPFVVIDRNVAERAKAISKAERGPWNGTRAEYDAMARKTAVHRLSPFLRLSTDIQTAMAVDGAVSSDPTASLEDVATSTFELGEPDPEPGNAPEPNPDDPLEAPFGGDDAP